MEGIKNSFPSSPSSVPPAPPPNTISQRNKYNVSVSLNDLRATLAQLVVLEYLLISFFMLTLHRRTVPCWTRGPPLKQIVAPAHICPSWNLYRGLSDRVQPSGDRARETFLTFLECVANREWLLVCVEDSNWERWGEGAEEGGGGDASQLQNTLDVLEVILSLIYAFLISL